MYLFRKCKVKRNAFALISVLILVSILSLIALEFSKRSGIGLRMAVNYAQSRKAYYYAYGGYQTALKLLKMDTNDYDGPGDYWYSALPPIPLEDGSLMVSIEDEKANFNIRKLVTSRGTEDERRRAMLGRIFDILAIDTNVIDAIVDWEDSDDVSLPAGAESAYYANLTPPYSARNAPIITTGELLLIKGIDRDLFFLPPSARNSYLPEDLEPLNHYITVYGDGKININTAKPPVIRCLSKDMDESIVDDIIEYREQNAFKKTADLKDIETIPDVLYDEIASLITVKSDIFRITATGTTGEFVETITAVVVRESRGFRVVYFNRSL